MLGLREMSFPFTTVNRFSFCVMSSFVAHLARPSCVVSQPTGKEMMMVFMCPGICGAVLRLRAPDSAGDHPAEGRDLAE